MNKLGEENIYLSEEGRIYYIYFIWNKLKSVTLYLMIIYLKRIHSSPFFNLNVFHLFFYFYNFFFIIFLMLIFQYIYIQDLLLLEEQEGSVNFKFGVLYTKPSQLTDDEMLSNGKCWWFSNQTRFKKNIDRISIFYKTI